jgi:farnesyl-diphosphate farnesyltransferase
MLVKVSRTFAVGTGILPLQLRRAVTVGYLICRIADTVEDDLALAVPEKLRLLEAFSACLTSKEAADGYAELASAVSGKPQDLELLAGNARVFDVFRTFTPRTQETITTWVGEMVRGMADFVRRHPEGIRIASVEEFRKYCYYVAGTVGHLLTELWREHSFGIDAARYRRLIVNCEAFGEALQTVNILKDIAWDAERENAIYIPRELFPGHRADAQTLLAAESRTANRASLDALIDLARVDLEGAVAYVRDIPPTAFRVRMFCLLPILFAVATLRELEQSSAMLEPGGGVKITRTEVKALVVAGSAAATNNASVDWIVDRVRRKPYLSLVG